VAWAQVSRDREIGGKKARFTAELADAFGACLAARLFASTALGPAPASPSADGAPNVPVAPMTTATSGKIKQVIG